MMSCRILLILTLLTPLAAVPAQEAKTKKDLDRLQGPWKVVRAEVAGMVLPKEAFQNVTITIMGDELTFREEDTVYDKITFVPDPSTKPKSAELLHTSGLKKGVREQAIYDLQGDQLKLCIGEERKKRPAEFASAAGTGQQLFILKRDKGTGGK